MAPESRDMKKKRHWSSSKKESGYGYGSSKKGGSSYISSGKKESTYTPTYTKHEEPTYVPSGKDSGASSLDIYWL